MATKFAGIGLNQPLKVAKPVVAPKPIKFPGYDLGAPLKVTPTLGAGGGTPKAYASTVPATPATTAKNTYINSQLPTNPNSAALSQLDSIRQQALGIQSQLQQQSASSNKNTPAAPTSTPTPSKPQSSSYDMAAKDYIASLGESDRVTSARQKYLNFVQSRDQGLQNIQDKRIPMQFITGQQRSLANNAEIQGARLQGDVALAQEQQQANQTQAKTLLDFEAEKLRMAQEQSKPIEVGGSLLRLNPETGQYDNIYTAPPTDERTSTQKDYEYARSQGFEGSFTEFNKPSSDGLTPYQKFSATQGLRKELSTNTASARTVQQQYDLMNEAYGRIERGEAKDLNATSQAIISTFNKILDPNSVVREGEYDRTSQGQSLIANIEGKLLKLQQGGAGITKESLKEIVDLGKTLSDSYSAYVQQQNQIIGQNAEAYGLSPELIIPGTEGVVNGSSDGGVSATSWGNF